MASKTMRLLRGTDQTVVGVEIRYEVRRPGGRISTLLFLSPNLLEEHIARLKSLGEDTLQEEEALAAMMGKAAGG
jgi:hypothetical protein